MTAKIIRGGLFALGIAAVSLCSIGSSLATDYKLGPRDKIRIKVYEWPALSDETTVSDEGLVSLPLIGRLNAAGISATDLARKIAEELQVREKLSATPYASVEVLQYRPFYILGDVQRPSDYQYRPGMTVMMALSIAGGMYRATDNLSFIRDAVLSRGSLSTLGVKKRELVVRLARLKGELSGKSTIEIDPEVLRGGKQPPGPSLQQESAIMEAGKKALANQIARLRLQISLYREEISLLTARMESSKKQQKSVEKEMQVFKTLGDKGLAILPREAAIERLGAQIEGDQREIDTLIVRSKQNIEQSEAAILKLIDERERELTVQIRQTSAQLEEVEQQLLAQQNLLYQAEALGGAAIREGQGEVSLRFSIVRRDPKGITREFPVQKDDLVEPGDVITAMKTFATRELSVGSDIKVPPADTAARAEIELRSVR
jgi:polysaccharide export outer membrane protein/exopolysaccharide production protein ExoF